MSRQCKKIILQKAFIKKNNNTTKNCTSVTTYYVQHLRIFFHDLHDFNFLSTIIKKKNVWFRNCRASRRLDKLEIYQNSLSILWGYREKCLNHKTIDRIPTGKRWWKKSMALSKCRISNTRRRKDCVRPGTFMVIGADASSRMHRAAASRTLRCARI